jgi:hypothetical protein
VERPPLRHVSGCFRVPPTRAVQWVRLVGALRGLGLVFPKGCDEEE